MKILVFGASGMVGQGVLEECSVRPDVESLVAVGRSRSGRTYPKLREVVHPDLFNLAPIEAELSGFDLCCFCLGTSAAGLKEQEYSRVTYELTLSIARVLLRLNPGMTFIYVSGSGTDSTEKGRAMWARVKGKTENALLSLGFRAAYMFRPGLILPLNGIKSKTRAYRIGYSVLGPIFPVLKALLPKQTNTTQTVAQAMLHVGAQGYSKKILEPPDINAAAAGK